MKKIFPFILLTITLIVGALLIFNDKEKLNNNTPIKEEQELKSNDKDISQDSIYESNNIEEQVKTSSVKENEKIETNKKNNDTPTSNSSNISSKKEEVNDQTTSNNSSNNNDSSTNETKKEETTNTTQPNENKTDMTVEFYKSITHGIKEFSSENDALARGYEITNNELDYVLDWNEQNPDNPIQPDINYFRVYPSAVDENGKYWYYLHFFCVSGERNDEYLKSKF